MTIISRGIAAAVAMLALAFALTGCGDDEAAQRKAFIEFLQTRIIDKPGIHVPQLTDDISRSIGVYAKHYAVITTFTADMDKSMSDFLPKMRRVTALTSIADAVSRRDDIVAVSRTLADARTALTERLAAAEAARAALDQPADLRPVYDAAFDRAVRGPVNAFKEELPPGEGAMQSVLALVDFLNTHRDQVTVQGSTLTANDPKVRSQVGAMLDDINAKQRRLQEGQARLNKLMTGG
jgi:hypothetical protein